MCILKYLACIFLYFNLHNALFAQPAGKERKINALFNDLPIDDPEGRSVLLEGQNPQEKITGNIFVRLLLNKTRCSEGEPLLLQYKLYTCLQSTSEIMNRPLLANFISFPMDVNNEEPRYEKINGRKYRVYNLLRYQLFPFRTGSLHVPSINVNNAVTYRDGATASKEYNGTVKSDEQYVLVEPIPVKEMPLFFSGAIGSFSISAKVVSPECKAGEDNELVVTIEGAGNFTNISLPEVKWSDNFKHFLPIENVVVDYSVFPSSGKKEFRIPFVASQSGNFDIAPLSFAYYDTREKKYQVIRSTPIPFRVLDAIIAPVQKTSKEGKGTPSGMGYFVFLLTAVVGTGVFIILKQKKSNRERRQSQLLSIDVVQQIAEENEATKTLLALDGLAETENGQHFIITMKAFLLEYLAKRFVCKIITEEAIINAVHTKDEQLGNDILQFIEQCDTLIYAPLVVESNTCALLANDFRSLLNRTERVFDTGS